MELKDITYRHIAIMLAKALPVESDDFRARVEVNLATIKRLPQNAKVALRSAYIFSQKVPQEERQDLFQDIALAVLKARTSDERLAYAIARCDWQDWWKKRFVRQDRVCLLDGLPKPQNHSTCNFIHKPKKCCECPFRAFRQMVKSLDSVIESEDGDPVKLGELIVGEAEFERKMDGKLDAQQIWNKLEPFPAIKRIIIKRLLGQALLKTERDTLDHWSHKFGTSLLLAES